MLRLAHSAFAIDRRSWLFSAVGTGLSFLLPPLSTRAADRRGTDRPKSLLTVWLAGGPSQLETWDPHPGSSTGGPTKSIRTPVAGLQIADLYPKTAEAIGHLSVIRSLVSKEGDHERGTYHLKTGYRPDPSVRHPALGSVLVHERPTAGAALPPHVALGGGQWPPRGGFLGDEFDAFRVGEPGGPVSNAKPLVADDRQKRRLQSLEVLEQGFLRGRPSAERRTLHRQTTQDALALMSSDQLKAFEIEAEPAAVRAAYGDHQLGKGCLVARRLIEAGVRAVEVTLDGFDTHANNFEAHATQAAALDPALSTLLNDLAPRDLLESTVVLVIGEFGRTPKVNPLDGRDHWPNGFSCLIGGGGLAAGRVIGATDPQGVKDPERPVPVADLFATVFAALDLDPAKELLSPIGRPLKLSEGTPVAELLRV